MNYRGVNILISNNCNIDCDFCCMDYNKPKKVIDRDLCVDFIKQLEEVQDIKYIGFSGGEVFLHFKLLNELIIEARKVVKNISIISNCFWAESYEVAIEKLAFLQNIGLTHITISYDDNHAKHVDREKIFNVLKACKKLRLTASIQSIILKDSKNSCLLDSLLPHILNVPIQISPCFEIGNAKNRISKDQFILNNTKRGLFCAKNGTLMIDEDGKVNPCCSPYADMLDFNLGNITDCTAEEIYKIIILKSKQFKEIYLFNT